MKIAVVHSFYDARRPSGENEAVIDQVRQLASTGYEVRLIGRHTSDQGERRLYRVASAVTVATGWGASPADELRDFEPDVIHLHNTFPNWGTRWLRHWGHRTVATMHNYRPLCANGLLFRAGEACNDCLALPVLPAVQHACYRSSTVASAPLAVASSPVGALHQVPGRVARVIVLNDTAAEVYRAAYRREVDVIPNFVPAGDPRSSPSSTWVYVGRLSDEKGIRELLNIWPAETRLDVIGAGPLESLVSQRAAQLGSARFLGSLPRGSILSGLSQYTGLVLPSMCAETLPQVMLEALAAGVPVVLSDRITTADEMVKAGVGVTFDPTGDASLLRAALRAVKQAGPEMRESARRLHATRYSARAWQDRIDQVYAAVCRISAAASPGAHEADSRV